MEGQLRYLVDTNVTFDRDFKGKGVKALSPLEAIGK